MFGTIAQSHCHTYSSIQLVIIHQIKPHKNYTHHKFNYIYILFGCGGPYYIYICSIRNFENNILRQNITTHKSFSLEIYELPTKLLLLVKKISLEIDDQQIKGTNIFTIYKRYIIVVNN